MPIISDQDASAWKEAYTNAMTLYAIIRGDSSRIKLKRASLHGDEVKADALDFKIDIELKAERCLQNSNERNLWKHVLDDPDSHQDLPVELQVEIGRSFLQHNLDAEGHYRVVYHIIKNDMDRRRLRFNEEEEEENERENL